MIQHPSEVAKFLYEIYEKQFGGKTRGRYKITRINLCLLSGRKVLKNSVVEEITYYALENHSLIVNELVGGEFSVIEMDVLRNYRPVPKSILNLFISDNRESELSQENNE